VGTGKNSTKKTEKKKRFCLKKPLAKLSRTTTKTNTSQLWVVRGEDKLFWGKKQKGKDHVWWVTGRNSQFGKEKPTGTPPTR